MSKNIYDSKQKGTGLTILTPNEMLKRLLIALAQIVYCLYRSKKITKKVYDNIIKSIRA